MKIRRLVGRDRVEEGGVGRARKVVELAVGGWDGVLMSSRFSF
jgi:hypothetical protein